MIIVIVQLLNHDWLFATPWTAAHLISLSFTLSWSLLKSMSIASVVLSNLCHQRMLSSSVTPFSSCPHSYLASGSFPMSWLFTLSDQSIRASVSVFPMNIYGWFPLRLTGLISLLSKGLSRVFSNTVIQKCHTLALSFLFGSILMSVNDHWKKNIAWLYRSLGSLHMMS